ncbi:hypothetical protein C807_03761 [Lachnospiraceae bacterium 28-4]|jgi:O-acetyl-ADP-ribose deacetylase (regulator of RNase III)|nr:hypothetical protein C807_03761 [Lachnospiraceae bacterium 28-4]
MIKAVKGDIIKIKVPAIVNAANEFLLDGSGVDGAIHRATGSQLLKKEVPDTPRMAIYKAMKSYKG